MSRTILVLMIPLLAFASAFGREGGPQAADIAWGEAQDGLACRIIVKKEFCAGEPVEFAVEFKNVSDQERTLLDIVSVLDPKIAALNIKGPSGAAIKPSQRNGHGDVFGPKAFKALAPGAVKRIEFREIRPWFTAGTFDVPGEYSLAYVNFGATPGKVVASQTQGANGKLQQTFDTPSGEEIAKSWKTKVESNTAVFKITPVTQDDLTVHEWGVFTVYNDVDVANAGLKAEWATLPDFFYRQFPKQRLRWMPAAWDKPILYFYTQREHLSVKVKLAFKEGAPVVWWPACSDPVNHGSSPDGQVAGFNALEWSAWLGAKSPPSEYQSSGADKRELSVVEVPIESWLNAARQVSAAALVTVKGSDQGFGKGAAFGRSESERFIYYDGLVPAPNFLACTAIKGALTVKNNAAFALRDLFVVDRRDGARDAPVRFAHFKDGLAAGAESPLTFRDVAAKDWPAAGASEVQAALIGAGLFKAEAQSVVEIWRAGFFERPGVTAFYLLPQTEYDRMLPLKISPAPGRTLRVGIALHPAIDGDPALTEKARQLIADLNAEDFNQREAAAKSLAEMGPVSIRELRAALKTSKDPETLNRCRLILAEIDATSYLEKKQPANNDPRSPRRR